MEFLRRGKKIYGGEVVSTGRRETCMYQTVKREHEDGGLHMYVASETALQLL